VRLPSASLLLSHLSNLLRFDEFILRLILSKCLVNAVTEMCALNLQSKRQSANESKFVLSSR